MEWQNFTFAVRTLLLSNAAEALHWSDVATEAPETTDIVDAQ